MPIALLGSLLLAGGAAGVALTPSPAQSQAIELVGDFPTTTASWIETTNASSTVEGAALRVIAVNPGQFGVCSGLLGGVEGGWSVTASADLDAGDLRTSSPATTLDFLDAGLVRLSSGSGGVAPEGTTYVQLCVLATAAEAGAELLILGATISATATATPAPTATSTATASPTASPTASSTPSETATASPTASTTQTPTASATQTSTATATSQPTAVPVAPTSPPSPPASTATDIEGLRNADFELGGSETPLYWDVRRGTATTALVDGGDGRSALITSGRATSWIEQLVRAEGGRWYEATARLAALERVSAGWVRIAWYATTDGSGGQTSTADSPTVEGGGGVWTTVLTGAVLAPPGTQSARVRILVRPGPEPARLAADEVTFEETPPPSTPTPAPALEKTPEAAPEPASNEPTPVTTPVPAAEIPPPPPAATPPGLASAPAGTGPVELVRITEVMADPEMPGNDASFEWVELTNFGAEPVRLDGAAFEDASGRTPLEVHLEAGATLVVAAPEAVFDADIDVWRVERIGNGLRNGGDIVRLLAPDGETLDEARWGDVEKAELRPGSGESVQRWFDDDARLLGERAGVPSPGRRTEPPTIESAVSADLGEAIVQPLAAEDSAAAAPVDPSPLPTPVATRVGGRSANDALWLVLFTLAGGVLGGLAVYRGLDLWRGDGH